MKKVLTLIFILTLLVATPLPSFANSLIVKINPEFPEEGEAVTISISSFVTKLQNTLIVWTSGEKTLLEGVGKTILTIPNASNQTINVEVIDRDTGERFKQTITLNTNALDVFWESLTSYTPPFYKGKALAPLESTINVTAMPHTSEGSYSYQWYRDGSRQVGQSGFEKNSFSFVGASYDSQHTISVTASKTNSSDLSKSVTVSYNNPEVVFYQDKGLDGISWNQSVESGFFVGDETLSLVAVPYFLSVPSIDSELYEMKWKVRGSSPITQEPKNRIRLSGASGISGKAIVSVIIEHANKLFEEGEVGVELVF